LLVYIFCFEFLEKKERKKEKERTVVASATNTHAALAIDE